MGYIREDELIQFPNQDNGTLVISGSYNKYKYKNEGGNESYLYNQIKIFHAQ